MRYAVWISGFLACCAGLTIADEPTVTDASIPGELSDGKPSPPPPPAVLPDFKIKSTLVREMDVVESPPMAGLPPVEGTITVTAHLVEDPKLPDPLPPPDISGTDPVKQSRMAEAAKRYQAIRFVSVSATVYDHSRTQLRCYPNGHPEQAVTAWSNVDFMSFGGVGSFEVKEADGQVRKYRPFMIVTGVDTKQRAALMAKHGREYVPPVIPPLADGAPAFVVEGETPAAGAIEILEDLHTLYRCEGERMKAALQARLEAQEKQKAWLLAHPPKPEDVTMHFWEREHPVGMSADTIKQGGGD